VSDQQAPEEDNLSASGSLSHAGGEAQSSAFIHAPQRTNYGPHPEARARPVANTKDHRTPRRYSCGCAPRITAAPGSLGGVGFLSADNWAVNRELIEAINAIAAEAIAAARLPVKDHLPGVRALDLWRDGPNGAMLFWADAEADLNGRREPVLYDVFVQRTDGAWREPLTLWAPPRD
jgi:hypothetical protein